jgi:integrase
MAKAKRKYISKTRDGRFRINAVDSSGKPHRPSFDTVEEAEQALQSIAAKKATGKKFVVGRGEALLTEAFDDLIELKKNEAPGRHGYRKGIKSVIDKHLRPTFGGYQLKEFAEGLSLIETWMQHQADHYHTGAAHLTFIGTVFGMTLREAIRLKKMDSPNPVTEFGLQIPQQNQKVPREALTLEQMSALVKAVLTKVPKHDRSELTWCSRWMMMLLGILAGLRNEECSGLYWDCVHFESRTISILRVWRDGEGIVPDTKSKGGKRIIPMSPMLEAALLHYGQRLVSMGRILEGPVLVCKGKDVIVKPLAISTQHWENMSRKAGLPDSSEDGRHTFYSAGRHTCINLWRACGIELDRVADLAGDKLKTIDDNYKHSTSIARFEALGHEVERRAGTNRPKEVIDALGRVLYERWLAEGVFDNFDIGCAPPPTDGAAPLALPGPAGNIIDLVPIAVSTARAPVEDDDGDFVIEDTRRRQIKKSRELKAKGYSNAHIAKIVHADASTVAAWCREEHIPHTRGKHKPDVFKEKQARFRQLRSEHPGWGTLELAKALSVRPGWVTNQARAQKNPIPHTGPGDYKLGQHEAAIREMADGGKTFRQMEKVLGVSFSAIALFAKKRGIQTKRWGGGQRVEQFDDDIRRLHAEGKNGLEIARELNTVHHSSIVRRIKALGLKSAPRGGRKTRT